MVWVSIPRKHDVGGGSTFIGMTKRVLSVGELDKKLLLGSNNPGTHRGFFCSCCVIDFIKSFYFILFFLVNETFYDQPTKKMTAHETANKIYHQLGNTQGIAVPRTLLEMFQRLQSFCLFMGARLKLLYCSWHIKLLIKFTMC